jgi:His-Xaa-Ser system radical SAM maturase HxsB
MYKLFPFRFEKNNRNVFITNEVGEYITLSSDIFQQLVSHKLSPQTGEYLDLKAKHIVAESNYDQVIDMLAIKYRTKKSYLDGFTYLHMVVPTLCCNSKCIYCQVSSKESTEKHYRMTEKTAKNVVNTIFKTPSQYIKIEFQGGEPLINFDIVRYIIEYAERINILHKKYLEFVICSNLTMINEKILHYLKEHKVYISTSLDGPKWLHDKNRPLRDGTSSYDSFMLNLEMARSILGKEKVSALMTSTVDSIHNYPAIIDEYVKQGFNYIFLRSLNPYGMAVQNKEQIGYKMHDYIEAYKSALDYIIDLNIKGTFFVEGYAQILLRRILTPFSTGFVDLQSPAGIGISGAIYNYDGNVYVSDEGRMLAAMGDDKFVLGNVNSNKYPEIFLNTKLIKLISDSFLECMPGCSGCAYLPFCGADPVRNYIEYGDLIGNRMNSSSCHKNKAIIRYLLDLIETGREDVLNVFWSWLTNRSIGEVRLIK